MKLKFVISIVITFALIALMQSCEKGNENENETKISKSGSDDSHNIGKNCMECHKEGGPGEGWFNVAGTVYDSLKVNTLNNATVKLYSDASTPATLKYTIQVDALGNFYTTEPIDFGSGLSPAVEGNLTTQKMTTKITHGKCNSCHGVITGKIWTK